MTEDQMIEDQDIELHDDDNEVVEEAMAHDPKNAEAQSVASVDKAGDATGSAPKRKGDQTKKDPMPKMPGTKAGMINTTPGLRALLPGRAHPLPNGPEGHHV